MRLAKVYTTTVVDHKRGFGLLVATVPPYAMPDGQPQGINDVCAPLGVAVRRRYDDVREPLVLAALAALVLYDGPALVADRIDYLLSIARDPLTAIDPSLRAFVTDCAGSAMIPVGEQASQRELADLITTDASEVSVAGCEETGTALLVGLIGLGTLVIVGPAGRGGAAVVARLAERVAPRARGDRADSER